MPIFLQPYAKYATFSGRATRTEFWGFYLFFCITSLISYLLDAVTDIPLFSSVFILGSIVPYTAVGFRRLHDTNRSGWWLIATLVLSVPAVIGGTMAAAMVLSGAVAGTSGQSVFLAGLFALIVAVVLNLIVTVFWFLPGSAGHNDYGSNPRGS